MRRPAPALLVLLTLAPAWSASLLPNAGFEGGFTPTGEATGWADNSRNWAKLEVNYREERTNPHAGASCQLIECPQLTYGAVQFIPQAGLPVAKGRIYHVQGWLRGEVGLVALQLRLGPAPYTVYCEKSLAVETGWRKLDYLWTSYVDDPDCRFMLRFTSPGKLWVDDLVVEEVTPERARALQPPPRPGNLLLNGNFDLDRANWLASIACDAWREADLQVVAEQGNPCLRITVPEGAATGVNSDVAPISDGHTVFFRCRLKADRPARVGLHLPGWSKQVDIGPEWQTVTTESQGAFNPLSASSFTLYVTGPVTVTLDDVELRHDKTTGDSAAHAALITTRHPLGLFHDGETPKLLLLASVPAGHGPVTLNWQVEDFWGKARLQGQARAATGRFRSELPLKGLPRGWYRARVNWPESGGQQTNECLFCVLPPPQRSSDPATSPFGGHFAVTPSNMAVAKAVGCRRLRLHPPNHTKWRVVEPAQGQWAWHDEAIQIALQQGFHLTGSLDRLPDWASSAPADFADRSFYTGKSAWLPRDWAEWERYVTETVRRYRQDIHSWEIWNEGNAHDWLRGRPGQSQAAAYLELLQHTTPIVRREDPTAKIIAGVTAGPLTRDSDPWRFSRELFANGALQLMDVLSFHEYITQSVDESGDPIQEWIPRVRGLMREFGRELPIINSEGGFYNPGGSVSYRPGADEGVHPRTMARWMVRQYVAQLAVGINEFFFYNMFIDGSPAKLAWQGFVDGDGQPSPNVAAYAAMTWLLDGASFVRTHTPEPGVWRHEFKTPRGVVTVSWTRTGTTRQVKLSGAKAAWTLMGAPVPLPRDGAFTLTDAPLYVLLGR